MKQIKYFGRMFYILSGSEMSSIYELEEDGSLKRTDWGFVQIALENGEEVCITQASEEELLWAQEKLLQTIERQDEIESSI